MGSLCGSGTSTATTSQSTAPVASGDIQNIYGKVASAASTPYTPYSGELTAGINGQQTAGINNINGAANYASPYFSQAGSLASNASNPLTTQQIQQYQNPYVQNVVNATQAQFNDQNAQGQNALKGTAAQQGALGGDRQAVAQAVLAGQQQTAQAPTIANLYANSYNSGLQTAGQQFQQNPLAAANALQSVGAGGQSAALQGAGAQINAGTLQQQTQQAADTANYGQYQAAQSFPYQQAAFQEQYGLPSALAQGSTSSGTQTSTPAPPNMLGQGLSLGTAALTAFSDKRVKENVEKVGKTFDGQPIYRFNYIGNPMTQIGLIAQDVEHSHPEAAGESGGIKTVDYAKATDDAADKGRFASGGSVPGYINAPDYINSGAGYIGMGQASQNTLQAPNLSFMKPPSDQSSATDSAAGKLLGTAAKGFSGSSGYLSPGSAVPDAFGSTSTGGPNGPSPLVDMYSSGGLVDAIHHIHRAIKGARYADGGAADGFGGSLDKNPSIGERVARAVSGGRNFGERALYNDTRAGLLNSNTASEDGPTYGGIGRGLRDRRNSDMLDAEMISRKVRGYDDGGTASFADRFQPAVDAPLVPFSPPDVVNPDTPFRMPDQKSVQAWRDRVDKPNPAEVADSSVPLPKEIINPDNAPAPSPMTTAFAPETVGSGNPMSIAPPDVRAQNEPQQASGRFGGFNPLGLSDKAREAIISGALGVAASRSPFLLNAVGEGGLRGMQSYSQASQAEQEAADKAATRAQTQQGIDMRAKELADTLEQHRRAAASSDLIPDAKGNLIPNPAKLDFLKKSADINEKIPPGYRATKDGLEAIPGGPADPSTIKSAAEAKRVANAVLDDDTIHDMADQYLAGDRTVMQNLGRGAQGAENIVKLRQAIAKQARDAGVDPKGIVNAFNEQAGALAGQRAVGTRAANISLAANEANNMIPIALAASDKLPRTQYMPWNSMVQAVQKGASSPELASFVAATNSLVNSYVRAVSPSGVPTDSMRQHAYDMLNAAQGPEAYKAVIATMKLEMEAALQAPGQVKAELRKGNEPAAAAGAPAAPAPPSTGTKPATIKQGNYTYTLQPDGSYK